MACLRLGLLRYKGTTRCICNRIPVVPLCRYSRLPAFRATQSKLIQITENRAGPYMCAMICIQDFFDSVRRNAQYLPMRRLLRPQKEGNPQVSYDLQFVLIGFHVCLSPFLSGCSHTNGSRRKKPEKRSRRRTSRRPLRI